MTDSSAAEARLQRSLELMRSEVLKAISLDVKRQVEEQATKRNAGFLPIAFWGLKKLFRMS